MKSYEQIMEHTVKLLEDNEGWIERYKKYYSSIRPDGIKNKYVTAVVKSFRKEEPLTKYLSIGRVKDSSKFVDIDLRINGHSIASYITELTKDIRKAIDDNEPDASVRNLIRNNSKLHFKSSGLKKVASSDEIIKNEFDKLAENYGDSTVQWKSESATEFRKLIKRIETKSTHSEHTVESQLLKRLASKKAKDKPILSIQPIIICGAFFQLVTPLKASEVETKDKIEYSKDAKGRDCAGGGIDILARIKNENNVSELCVIELKDNYTKRERPVVAIKQAIAYATFLDCLIRCEDAKGEEWYKNIFGIGKGLDETIKINAVVAMPYKDKDNSIPEEDRKLAGKTIMLENGDIIELHYFFFDKECLYDEDMRASCSLKTFNARRKI